MNSTTRKTLFVAGALALGCSLPTLSRADNPPPSTQGAGSDASTADQQDNNFYWQGTQLYNLGRLGEAFDSFEKAIQKKQNSKEAEAYLLQIRQEIVNNAKNREKERSTVDYGKNTPDSALNVVYLQKGYIRVTLQAQFLFDENTAALKAGSMDVLDRLAGLLEAKEGNRVELTFLDNLDATPESKNIDAERALVVFSLLNFKRLAGDENS